MKRPLLVADLFCGAGGSSTGARRALAARGMKMNLVALNHWDVAIETHQKNHPEADHFLVNVYKAKPREVIPGGRLDLLMASPTCTFHSRARGGRPISKEQKYGRMTPTQVIRWVTELSVRCLLVENVPEFVNWGPVHGDDWMPWEGDRCDRNRCQAGKPCRAKKGYYFRAWIKKLEAAGFRVEWRLLNAADYGSVSSRERFFLIGRSDRRRIRWPIPTHSKDGTGELFSKIDCVRKWRGAKEIIDWALPGRSIFKRKKPLSDKTLARIYAGAERFGWPPAFLVILRNHMDGKSVDDPLPTLTAGGTHIGLAQPMVVRTNMHRSNSKCVRGDDEPLPTVTTDGGLGVVQPFVLNQDARGAPRSTEDPIPTVATDGAHALLTPYYGQSQARPVDDPVPTVTTKDRFGLVIPVTHDDTSKRQRSLEEPLPTITGANRGELAFIVPGFGERPTQTPRTHDINEPTPTICADGHMHLVHGRAEPIGIDILFRMLQPHELAAAMGFSDDEIEYEFAGTKTDIIKQIGNAVDVYNAEALIGAIFG